MQEGTQQPRPVGNWFAAMPVIVPVETLEELKRQAPAGNLRWFAPEDLHLTVAFFGRFREERLEAVLEAVRSLPAFHIEAELGRLRPLPSPRRFSALSFELEQGAREAAELMERAHEPLMAAAGVPPEQRAAYPHVTIARPSRQTASFEKQAMLRWCEKSAPLNLAITLNQIGIYGWAEDRSLRQFRRLDV